MELVAGSLNLLILDTEQKLLQDFSTKNAVFINFSFKEAIKTSLYVRDKKINNTRKSEIEAILGFKYPKVEDKDKTMELIYVATDILANIDKIVFIGVSGCAFDSIEMLRDFFRQILLNNPNKTVVIVEFTGLPLPEFKFRS